MRDMLFSMPLGPMPGLKVETKPAPEPQWRPVEGRPHVETDGKNLRTNLPTFNGAGIGSKPGCFCDSCVFFRKLGQ